MDFDKPLNPLTRPPEDMEKSYLPSSERLMVIGRRLETRRRRPSDLGSEAMVDMIADNVWRVLLLSRGRGGYTVGVVGVGGVSRRAMVRVRAGTLVSRVEGLRWRLSQAE